MKITEVKTFLMGVGQTPRNWLFVKVYTDEGITGVGEASGWPKVIKAAIDDISPMVIGEDPMHIEKELVDVIQPDAGRVGGISQLKKLSAMAESHYITVAPHSGTLGPVGEYAALHVMASIPNALALERVEFDDPRRYEVIDHHISTVDGFVPVPDRPGLGVDIIEEAVAKYPSTGNSPGPRQTEPGMHKWEPGTYFEQVYFQPRFRRQHTMSPVRDMEEPE